MVTWWIIWVITREFNDLHEVDVSLSNNDQFSVNYHRCRVTNASGQCLTTSLL